MSISAKPSKPTIIFFDNDERNLRDFDSNRHLKSMFNIINILVDDKTPNEFCGDKTDTTSKKLEYINHFKRFGNSYAELTVKNGGEHVVPSRGITANQHTELLQNIDKIPGKKIAIFDWDRTITVIEGMLKILDHNMIPEHNMIPDMIVYLCGGEERLSRLQEMFSELHRKNVEVFILSNNAYADKSNSEENFELLKKLLKFLDPNMEEDHIIGCIRKTTKLIKSEAFLQRYSKTPERIRVSLPPIPTAESSPSGKIFFTSPRTLRKITIPSSPRSPRSPKSVSVNPRTKIGGRKRKTNKKYNKK